MRLTGDHFVADAAGITNGWQISDFESVLYMASQSAEEKQYWMHAVAGVVRRLMEPMDALPPQYATVAMHRHATTINKGPAFDHTTVPATDAESAAPDEASTTALEPEHVEAEAAAAREAAGQRATNEEASRLEAKCGELEKAKAELMAALDEASARAEAAMGEASRLKAELAAAYERSAADSERETTRTRSAELATAEAVERLKVAEEELAEARVELSRQSERQSIGAALDEQAAKWTRALALERERSTELSKKCKALGEANRRLERDLEAAKRDASADREAGEDRAARAARQVEELENRLAEARASASRAREAALAEAKTISDERRRAEKEAAESRAKVQALQAEVVSLKCSSSRRTSVATKEKAKPPPPPPLRQTQPPADLEQTLVRETTRVWSRRADAARLKQELNAFSSRYQVDEAKKVPVDKDAYGTPPPGSLTEQRWHKGQAWVDQQIDNLLAVIRDIGTTDDHATTVTFGDLFYKYSDISDSLVIFCLLFARLCQRAHTRRSASSCAPRNASTFTMKATCSSRTRTTPSSSPSPSPPELTTCPQGRTILHLSGPAGGWIRSRGDRLPGSSRDVERLATRSQQGPRVAGMAWHVCRGQRRSELTTEIAQ